MKNLFAALLIATSTTAMTVNMAKADDMNEGKELAMTVFKSIDENERGFIDMGEFNTYGGNVFVSMDADDDGNVDIDEFLFWDFGMQSIAADRGAEEALKTAMRVVHSFWDRNGDGNLTRSEHRSSTIFDFQRADLDGDAVLTTEEFLSGFTVMKAIRAAVASSVK